VRKIEGEQPQAFSMRRNTLVADTAADAAGMVNILANELRPTEGDHFAASIANLLVIFVAEEPSVLDVAHLEWKNW